MGQFFKFLFASCLGVVLAILGLSFIGTIMLVQVAANAEKPEPIQPNSVLHLTFDNPIPEKTNNLEMDPFDLENQKILGLQAIRRSIELAKEDDNIKGIFLDVDGIYAGFATAAVLRDALVDFKESGKFIMAYSKYYTQGAYYLASTADEIHINPLGMIDFRGFAAQVPFFKQMLDKVGVKMQVYYAGKFKSATEPYRRESMSDESRLQIREYIDEMYQLFLTDISETRGISVSELKRLADEYAASDPERALAEKMIDKIGYRDETLEAIRNKLGLDEEDKLELVSLKNYSNSNPWRNTSTAKERIAIIYAEGTILDGKGENGKIGDETYVKLIDKARKDDRVKAVVLRVNSPGGSAMSSENIWRAMSRVKEAGKPVVVSMGDYAASGGYYISCLADSIIAEPNTLTGSIGVFNMIPSAQKLLNDKLGIRFDTVKTGQFSHGITPFYNLSPEEGRIIQKRTDSMYETFLKRVSDGRGMNRDQVHEIAQGRVWTGSKAKEIGLIDALGDLESAVEVAANMSDLEEFRLVEYPKPKEALQEFLERFTGMEDLRTEAMVKKELGTWYPQYQFLKELQSSNGMQMRLPFLIPFN